VVVQSESAGGLKLVKGEDELATPSQYSLTITPAI
jgi:hypothetical protein